MPAQPQPDHASRLRAVYREHGDKARYLVVGSFNTAFGYGMFLAMLALTSATLNAISHTITIPPTVVGNRFLIAQWTAWALSVPVGTYTMKRWVFHGTGRLAAETRRAYAVYLPSLALSSVLLWLFVQVIGLSPQVGQLLTILLVVQFGYLGHKYFTFKADPVVGTIATDPAEQDHA